MQVSRSGLSQDFAALAANAARRIVDGVEGIEGVCLLGSVARGDATEFSDIDLLVIGSNATVTPSQITKRLGRRGSPHVSVIYYSLDQLAKQRRHGALFIEHVRQEGAPLYDKRGILEELFSQPYHPAIEFDLRRYLRRLRLYRHPERFGGNHLFCLAHLYSLSKGVVMVALASRGIFRFNRDEAFRTLVDCSPALERPVRLLSTLRPYYALVGGRRPEPLPRSFYNADALVSASVEAVEQVAAWIGQDGEAIR